MLKLKNRERNLPWKTFVPAFYDTFCLPLPLIFVVVSLLGINNIFACNLAKVPLASYSHEVVLLPDPVVENAVDLMLFVGDPLNPLQGVQKIEMVIWPGFSVQSSQQVQFDHGGSWLLDGHNGPLGSEWEYKGDSLFLRLTLPACMTASGQGYIGRIRISRLLAADLFMAKPVMSGGDLLIDNVDQFKANVFPDSWEEIREVFVRDMRGQVVRSTVISGKGDEKIDLNGIPNGMYLIMMRSSRGVLTRKIILTR